MGELSKLVKYERQFNWSLTKHKVETELGREITNEEFYSFAKHFEKNFIIQYAMTLEWQANAWDNEVSHWEEPDDMDISFML